MNIGKVKTEERIFHAPPPVQPRAVGFVPVIAELQTTRKVSCNCKNSRCVKLYCECFRNETFCKDCNCECCLNKTDNPTRKNTIGMMMFQNFAAPVFLNGFRSGMLHNTKMVTAIIQANFRSKRKPISIAEPENALPGGLYAQKIMNLKRVITTRKLNITVNIQRNNLGIRCINCMNNY